MSAEENGKRSIDWEKIEEDYRAGIKSSVQIAKEHGITEGAIRKKAKQQSWERDLSYKVRQKVRTELVRVEPVRGPSTSPAEEAEIVRQAAATQIEVVRSHRKSIGVAQRAVDKLLLELHESSDFRDDIIEAIELETENDRGKDRRAMMMRAVALPSRSGIVDKLSSAMTKLVTLERQAFNIADERGGDGEESAMPVLDGLMKELAGVRKRMQAAEALLEAPQDDDA